MNVPQTEPKLLIEPIHDSSSFVSGPVMRGVLFDRSTGNAGEVHPKVPPWLNIMKLALMEMNTQYYPVFFSFTFIIILFRRIYQQVLHKFEFLHLIEPNQFPNVQP